MKNKTHTTQILLPLILTVILSAGIITGCKKLKNNPQPEAVLKKQPKFVAVAGLDSNKAAYSEDGINWFEIKLPDVANWSRFCYGNGKFVVVGNKAAYSEDGIKWTTLTDEIFQGNRVCYGNGKFVTVYHNKAAYSNDGIKWAETILPIGKDWERLYNDNGRFIAIASDNSKRAVYSDDGINWKAARLPDELEIEGNSLCYGDGKFIIVSGGYGGQNRAAYSEDGSKWTRLPDEVSWGYSVDYYNGKFVTISFYNAAYSEDGIIWKTTPLPVGANWYSVCYGNGKFVAVGAGDIISGNDKTVYSKDGIIWKEATMPYAYWQSVCYGNGKFVAVGADSRRGDVVNSNRAAYSTDGINWIETTLPAEADWVGVGYCED